MAAATSPATGEAYGVRRVCTIWALQNPRSTTPGARRDDRPRDLPADAARNRRSATRTCSPPFAAIWPVRRGPQGPSQGLGAAAVIDGIRVSRTRVLRLMRENSLLSPHRRPPRPANDDDGSITTDAPNVMWGADGAVIPTIEDGSVTLFIVAEHWNAEGLGRHVAKHGNRYAAAAALALAVSGSSAPSAPMPGGVSSPAMITADRSCPVLPEPADFLRHGAQLRLRPRARKPTASPSASSEP